MFYERIAIDRALELIDSPSAPPILIFLCDNVSATDLLSRLRQGPDGEPRSSISIWSADDNPDEFVARLFEAFDLPEPSDGLSCRSPVDRVAILLNTLLDSGRDFRLVIEGAESIRNVELKRSVSYLLEYLPESLKVTLLARQNPAVGVSRLLVRARARVFIVVGGARDLEKLRKAVNNGE